LDQPSPDRSPSGKLEALVDGLLPPAAWGLSPVERWRLRMAMGTSLLLAVLLIVAIVLRGCLPGKTTQIPLHLLFALAIFGGNAVMPRLLGAVRLPTGVLSVYPLLANVAFSMGDPTFTSFAPLLPLLGGFFGGRYLAIIGTLVGTVELLVIGGPLVTPLPPHALSVRLNCLFITGVVGGVVYLSDRFLLETDRERNQAREEALRLTREQAWQLRQQGLRVAMAQALAGAEPLSEALHRCCEAVLQHVGAAAVGVWLLNEKGDVLELAASVGAPALATATHARVRLYQPGLGRVAAQRVPVLGGSRAGDTLADPEWLKAEGIVASAAAPLVLGERRVGVLAVYAQASLPEDAMEALGAAADPLAQGVERKRVEHALTLRAEELARSNQDLEHFAYVASHDLQEPLRMVSSYTQLLSRRYRDRLDTDANDFIGFVLDGVDRMQRLIRDLLQYSRVAKQRKEFTLVDTEQILEQALSNLKPRIEESGALVTHEALPVVLADDVQLGQLFLNLLSNALKFRRSDVSPRIHISAQKQGDEWLFSVRDNGIGIAPEQVARLFVLFQRLHAQSEYPGTGIGLALCKRIVEGHGGQIRLESQPGDGSCFIFSLPAQSRSTSSGLSPRSLPANPVPARS